MQAPGIKNGLPEKYKVLILYFFSLTAFSKYPLVPTKIQLKSHKLQENATNGISEGDPFKVFGHEYF